MHHPFYSLVYFAHPLSFFYSFPSLKKWEERNTSTLTSGVFPSPTHHSRYILPLKHQLKRGALKVRLLMLGYRRLACLCHASTRKCKSRNFKTFTWNFRYAELIKITYMGENEKYVFSQIQKKSKTIIIALIKRSFSCFSDIAEVKNNLYQYLKDFFFIVWILQWTVGNIKVYANLFRRAFQPQNKKEKKCFIVTECTMIYCAYTENKYAVCEH